MRSLPTPPKQRLISAHRFLSRSFKSFFALSLSIACLARVARADDAASQPAPAPSDNTYSVDNFAPVFEARAGQPSANASFQAEAGKIIDDTSVTLGISSNGYIAPTPNTPSVTRTIAELNVEGSAQFSQNAILTIDKAIVRQLNAHGYGAVLAVPSPNDIDPQDSTDLRVHRRGTLHILISVPTAGQVRTVSSGDRLGSSPHRVNNPKLQRILHNSPVQPSTEPSGSESSGNATPYFDQKRVNDYVDRLNRQPGRRVDVALSAADQPDQFTLDYLVNEIKPWYVYAQVSNTGTPITGEWRERFGFVDNQLSGNDDILNIDAVTDFNHSTNVTGSYEFPLFANDPDFGTDRLRVRVYGLWDEYEAADLGILSNSFSGNDYSGGAEIAWNVLQFGNAFLDLIGGFRYQDSQVTSSFEGTKGTADYYLPYVGARLQEYEPTFYYSAGVNGQGGITSDSRAELANLGRTNPDSDFILVQPNIQGSFYLEPLIDAGNFQEGRSTLAHELYFSARGQWALNYRLIPQFEQAAGGFYSVRGYPEAVTAGDTVFLETAEYRFHLARFLGVSPNPTKIKIFGDPFRVLPEQPYQRPDWDLILRGFIDAGEVTQSKKVAGEFNETLVGAGAGVELQVRQNIDIRTDYGVALNSIASGVKSGSGRFTLLVTFLY